MNERDGVDEASVDGYQFASYREWRLHSIPWLDGETKIAATRYAFFDTRSPVVHKNFKPDADGIQREVAERKVKEMIDKIEDEGLEIYMAREFPDSKNRGLNE